MHAKQKGNIAESATTLLLQQNEFAVFTELGDLSKVDLIAEKNNKLARIQVKGTLPAYDGSILRLHLKKSGPNYEFKYQEEQIDFFAICNLETLEVGFVPSSILRTHSNIFCLRLIPPNGGNQHGCKYFKDYQDINIVEEYFKDTGIVA